MLASSNRKPKLEAERLPPAALRTLMTMGFRTMRSGYMRHACTFSIWNSSDIKNPTALIAPGELFPIRQHTSA